MTFSSLYFFAFWVRIDLFHDFFNLFKFQIDNVVHDTLCQSDMFLEQFKVEISFRSKRIYYIRVQVDGQQTAGVVRTQRNFTTRIG